MNKKWIKQELKSMLSEEDERLWDDYESGELKFIENTEEFDKGWRLGHVDAVSELLRRIEIP